MGFPNHLLSNLTTKSLYFVSSWERLWCQQAFKSCQRKVLVVAAHVRVIPPTSQKWILELNLDRGILQRLSFGLFAADVTSILDVRHSIDDLCTNYKFHQLQVLRKTLYLVLQVQSPMSGLSWSCVPNSWFWTTSKVLVLLKVIFWAHETSNPVLTHSDYLFCGPICE